MKTGYYRADAQNGVWYYDDILDDPDAEIISPHIFYENLKYLDEDEVMYTFFEPHEDEIYQKIKDEYGIDEHWSNM